jgi:hypothetical protein
MTNTLSLLLVLFLFNSCSPIIQYFDNDDKIKLKEKKLPKLYCPVISDLNITHQSSIAVDDFLKISKTLKNKYHYNFVEMVMSYLVYQSIVRPDSSHLNSRLQVFITNPKKDAYYDLNQIGATSYRDILTILAKDFTTRPVKRLLAELKRVFPTRFKVQEQLQYFLAENKAQLKNNDQMRDFFKLARPLQKGETFPRRAHHFNFNKKRVKLSPAPLFNMKIAKNNSYKLSCNFDSGLYQNGLFIVRKKQYYTNSFALNDEDGHSFIAFSSRSKKEALSSKQSTSLATPAPFCFYQDNSKKITLMSFDSKDPGQILYHLINYDIFNTSNPAEVMQYLSFPRHEILSKPSRLLFESKLSSKEQLNYFLSRSIPIYHAESLGQVWTLFRKLNQDKHSTFITDTRKRQVQSCMKDY